MDTKSLYIKGLKLSKSGAYAKAIVEFDKVLERNPENAEAFSDRGVAKYHLNDLKGSLADLNQALSLEPENPYRYASRAYIRERSGDTHGAIEDYRKALELDPENAVSHNNLGLLEEKLGYQAMADKRFKVADKLAENPDFQLENIKERDALVQDLLSDLNIPLEQPKKEISLLSQMLKVFSSKEDRKDFSAFLKSIFKKK